MCRAEDAPFSWRRVVGAVTALGFGAIAAYLAVAAAHRFREFDNWLIAEPTRFSVDLSRTGRWEAPFIQTCEISHGQSIVLSFPDGPDFSPSIVAGLRGQLEVVGSDGTAVVAADLPDMALEESSQQAEGIELVSFHPFETGTYTLRLQVIEPAPALAGHDQVVFARYELCGLEQMPAVISAGLSIVAALPALIIGAFTTVGLVRHGWSQEG